MSAPLGSPDVHVQHPDGQHPTAKEPRALGGDANPAAELQKTSKKRKSTSRPKPCKKVPSRDALGRLPRLRPLYNYINLSVDEMCPEEEDGEGSAPAGLRQA
ncbi:uncharacterized protein C16orf86 homolog [Cyrtonyx montezumae]|uniref:uncharacterized protein C16orf86 homolog n=1 Tax=Cyrtonyx montezumae TaxID=9017 RepID=UPI0032DA7634